MSKIELTPETVQKLITAAVEAALSKVAAERKDAAISAAKDGKSERSIKNEIAATKAFKKAGYGDVKLHEEVKTYNRWLAVGRKVKTGEHAVKVKNLRLFHISQTEVISKEEKDKAMAEMQAAIAKRNAETKGETKDDGKRGTILTLPNKGEQPANPPASA